MTMRFPSVAPKLDRWKPEFGDVNAAVSVDVVTLEADVDGFLDASGVPMWFQFYTLHIVPIRMVTSFQGVFSYRRSVHTAESHVELMLLDPLADTFAGFTDVHLVALG